MIIKKIYLKNFRNLKEIFLEFSEKTNFFCGKNGLGKTNLLESLWMLTGARSFRGAKDKYLINFEEKNAKIEGFLFTEKRDQEIEILFENNKRKGILNGIPKPSPTNLIGKTKMVIFSPNHLSLIKDGPEKRRKFLDAALCQQKKHYVSLIIEYKHILRQRNALLKEIFYNNHFKNTLDVWDEKLAITGEKIVKERLGFIESLKKEVYNFYDGISKNSEKLEISYDNSEFTYEKIIKKLEENRNLDIKYGYTSVGPHKNDLSIFLNKKDLKLFGSQGQQRSTVLALKLAEASVLREKTEETPVILLDDVMSELDFFRREYLTQKIQDYQVFITGCDILENTKKEIKVFKMPFKKL